MEHKRNCVSLIKWLFAFNGCEIKDEKFFVSESQKKKKKQIQITVILFVQTNNHYSREKSTLSCWINYKIIETLSTKDEMLKFVSNENGLKKSTKRQNYFEDPYFLNVQTQI